MKERELRFLVTLKTSASRADAKDFIRDLEWVGGCRHPDDEFFNMRGRVKVTHCRPESKLRASQRVK